MRTSEFLLHDSTFLADPAPKEEDVVPLLHCSTFTFVHIDICFSPTQSDLSGAKPSRVVATITSGARLDVFSAAFHFKYLTFAVG